MNNFSRKYVGGRIHAKATFVTAVSECRRRFGARYKEKMLNGTVLNCSSKTSRTSNKRQTFVQGEFEIGDTTRVVELLLRNVGRGHIPDIDGDNQSQSLLSQATSTTTPSTNTEDDTTVPFPNAPAAANNITNVTAASVADVTDDNTAPTVGPGSRHLTAMLYQPHHDTTFNGSEPVTDAHGTKWFDDQQSTQTHINGEVRQRAWYYELSTGTRIGELGDTQHRFSRYEYFLMMYPYNQLESEARWTSKELTDAGKEPTTPGELLKYKGIQLLATRFQFNKRSDLWSTTTTRCRYIAPPNFGMTGMSRQRFDDITSCLRCSWQPKNKPDGVSSENYRWMLVEQFVQNFNMHRAKRFFPGEVLCADESISRWYGLGGQWINAGLPQYVALDRKPHNGCKNLRDRHELRT